MQINFDKVKLLSYCKIIMGQSPPSSTYNNGGDGLPFFQGKAEFTDLHPIPKKWCSKPKKVAEPNDILISVRAPVGATNIANQKCCIGRGLAAIRYPDCPKYIFYYFRLIEKDLDKLGTGSTFKAISGNVLKNLEIPFPPLKIQHRIVEKIEELFSELENGVESLKKAKEQIGLYKQSVLRAAFRGELVDGNRKSEIGNQKRVGEIMKAAEPGGEYEVDGLPEGWKWVKFIDFCKLQRGYDLPLKKIVEGEYPVVTSGGVNGYHNEYKAKGPCLVTGRSGGVGNIHYLDIDYYWPHNTVLYVKDFCGNFPKFVYYFFLQFSFKFYSSSTAIPTLDRKKLYDVLVKVPPYSEQVKIVAEIERRFSEAEHLEKSIDEGLAKAEALRQSILKQAFEGRLVS